MKIELKNIRMHPELNGAFDAFSAKLYIDDRYVADVRNKGRDIVNRISANDGDCRKLISEAEKYCLQMPDKNYEHNGQDVIIKMNLSNYIDDLVTKHLAQAAEKRHENKVKRAMETGIVIGIPGHSLSVLKFKMPIEMLLVHPTGPEVVTRAIKETILPELKDGIIVLNTNIPERFLQEAGLNEKQYIPQSQQPEAKRPQKKKGSGIK